MTQNCIQGVLTLGATEVRPNVSQSLSLTSLLETVVDTDLINTEAVRILVNSMGLDCFRVASAKMARPRPGQSALEEIPPSVAGRSVAGLF